MRRNIDVLSTFLSATSVGGGCGSGSWEPHIWRIIAGINQRNFIPFKMNKETDARDVYFAAKNNDIEPPLVCCEVPDIRANYNISSSTKATASHYSFLQNFISEHKAPFHVVDIYESLNSLSV